MMQEPATVLKFVNVSMLNLYQRLWRLPHAFTNACISPNTLWYHRGHQPTSRLKLPLRVDVWLESKLFF